MTVVVKTWSRIFSLYSGSFSVRIGEILETTSLCSIGRLSLFQIVWWKYPSQRGLQGTFFTKLDDFAVFGETTPSGRPCKAHRSPNVLAQGFRCASRVSRCVTSGWKTPFYALLAPDLSHQEIANVPSRPFWGTFCFSWSITSGAESASHALLAPDVSHQEATRQD